jgi:hypothetical protein
VTREQHYQQQHQQQHNNNNDNNHNPPPLLPPSFTLHLRLLTQIKPTWVFGLLHQIISGFSVFDVLAPFSQF